MKIKQVGAFEAKTHLSALLDEVEQGTVVQITRHGTAIAELRPLRKAERPRFGSAKGRGFKLDSAFDEALSDFDEYVP